MRPHASLSRLLAAALLGLALPVHAREHLDGPEVYRNNCGRCHMPQTPGDLSPEDWRAVSFHMRVKAHLTPREFEALERFLVPEQHGEPAPSGRAVDRHPEILSICTRCHDTERIQAAVDAGRTREAWLDTLERMHEYDAPIEREEFAALADWLAWLAEHEAPAGDGHEGGAHEGAGHGGGPVEAEHAAPVEAEHAAPVEAHEDAGDSGLEDSGAEDDGAEDGGTEE